MFDDLRIMGYDQSFRTGNTLVFSSKINKDLEEFVRFLWSDDLKKSRGLVTKLVTLVAGKNAIYTYVLLEVFL